MRGAGAALAAALMLLTACGEDPSKDAENGAPDNSSPASPLAVIG